MSTVLFTGFPGFLGSELLPRVLRRHEPSVTATCLVQPKFAAVARDRARELSQREPALGDRVRCVEGDVAKPDLGLGPAEELKKEVVEIFHLAAVYDLSVPRALAMRVNLDGTRHVLQLASGCAQLKRFQYVSTCYVSGRHVGAFTENDLELGQSFNNYYEESKYLAEVEVQRKMRGGLPTTIYRPSIVVGDSSDGATQKYDGPYFVLQWLIRQPRWAIMPVTGHPELTRVNLVPRDYVIEAIAYLSGLDKSLGKVYQLCDPNALTASQTIEAVGEALHKNLVKIPLPSWLARNALQHGPGIQRWMGIPPEALDYFALPTHFTCNNTLADLQGSGIRCPPFRTYLPRLVTFMREHPEIGSAAMA
jgi:thioester reductase-like protein